MKKEYEPPKMQVIEMEMDSQLLAHSGWDGPGNANACKHGNHWFCPDEASYEDD